MTHDEERKLLLDLVTAASGALLTIQNTARYVEALSTALKRKALIAPEEIDDFLKQFEIVRLDSDGPVPREWSNLIERLEAARQRLLKSGEE